jgi:hypothetical protein
VVARLWVHARKITENKEPVTKTHIDATEPSPHKIIKPEVPHSNAGKDRGYIGRGGEIWRGGGLREMKKRDPLPQAGLLMPFQTPLVPNYTVLESLFGQQKLQTCKKIESGSSGPRCNTPRVWQALPASQGPGQMPKKKTRVASRYQRNKRDRKME